MHVIHTRQVHDFDVERSLRHGLNQLSTIPCWLVFFTAGATEIVSPTSCTYSLVHTWTWHCYFWHRSPTFDTLPNWVDCQACTECVRCQ